VLAAYFVARAIPQKAQAALASANQDWTPVRTAVNGGLNGYDRFYAAVQALRAQYVASGADGSGAAAAAH
jgi:predicted chitinase